MFKTKTMGALEVIYTTFVLSIATCLIMLTLLPPQQRAVGAAQSIPSGGVAYFKQLAEIGKQTTLTQEQKMIRQHKAAPTTTTTTTVKPSVQKPVAPKVDNIPWQDPSLVGCNLVYNYDWPQEMAFKVCQIESGGNPYAANMRDYHPGPNCYGSYGLMQINCGAGILYDGELNMLQAYSMWKARGWQPWINTCKKIPGCTY